MKIRVVMLLTLIGGIGALSITYSVFAQSNPKVTKIESIAEMLGGLNGRYAVLSPDGTMLAYPDPKQGLCLYPFATKTLECKAYPETYRDNQPLYWSPDSKYIAFTEDLFRKFRESDIWLFDVAAKKIVDLTDDHNTDNILKAANGTPFDVFPVWDTVSGDLYFFRYARQATTDGKYSQTVYRIAPTGGEPKVVRDLTNDIPGPLTIFPSEMSELQNTAVVSPDGKQIALVVRPAKASEFTQIWILDLDGATPPKQVVVVDSEFNSGLPTWEKGQMNNIEGVAWTQKGDGLVFYADMRRTSAQAGTDWRNVYYTDFKTVTPLIDFSSISNQADLFRMDAAGHSKKSTVPVSAAYLAKQNVILMFGIGPTATDTSLYAVPITGSGPIRISDVPEYDGPRPANGVSVTTDGSKVLLFGYIFTLGE